MAVRKILRLVTRAAGISAAALALSGCVSPAQRPVGYNPAWTPSSNIYSAPAMPPRVVVLPRQQFYQQPAQEPYRPPPVAAGQPSADPAPLRPVDPPDSHAIDESCVGIWRLCHFF